MTKLMYTFSYITLTLNIVFASMKANTFTSDYGIIASTATFSSTTLLATTSGNVGIGTVAPTTKLEVIGNVKATSIQTNNITFNASQYVNKISTDPTLQGNLDTNLVTEKAVKTYIDNLVAANSNVPAGTISAFGGTTAPSGYLLCDGSEVWRNTYSKLFTAIGTNFGTGNGSTTFNIPDLRGMFVRGKNNGRNDGWKDPDGERNIGSYQFDEFKSHSHTYQYKNNNYWISAGPYQVLDNTNINSNTGSAGGNETRPKNVAVNYIIKY